MLIVLRLLHIVAGAFWVGAVVFLSTMLLPAMRAAGPAAAGAVSGQLLQVRKLPVVMLVTAWTTILSGAALSWRDAGTMGFAWFAGPGRGFGFGAVFALVAVIIGMTVNTPTGKKVGMLNAQLQKAGRPPSPEQQAEMQRLQARLGSATIVVTVLVVLALAAMAVARYLP
jgi:uncharacterized membrane protein